MVDLDGSLRVQAPFTARYRNGDVKIIDAVDLAPHLRIFATRRNMQRLVERLGEDFGYAAPEIIFYGSGDFHHLTAGFLSRVQEPITVIHFDNHPDWVRFPSTFNCGAWVNRALEMPQVLRVITLGVCSSDLVFPELKMANLPALRSGRLELYPWYHAPSYVLGNYDSQSARQKNHLYHWRNLAYENWPHFLTELMSRLPTKAIWVTIDKDVLDRAEALTNWDQGHMRLDQILTAIKTLAENFSIKGIDVCGDYSSPKFKDPLRAVLAVVDHPRLATPSEEQLQVNARTNEALLSAYERIFS